MQGQNWPAGPFWMCLNFHSVRGMSHTQLSQLLQGSNETTHFPSEWCVVMQRAYSAHVHSWGFWGKSFQVYIGHPGLQISKLCRTTQSKILGGSVKESACNAGDLGLIPGSGRPLEKEMATHSSILTWDIPRMEEPACGLQSLGLQ